MRKLTREQKRDIRAIAARRDEDIDFSDAPAVLVERSRNRQVLSAKEEALTMRLDVDVIAWLKADGRGYQTKANWLLRNAMLYFTKGANVSRRRIAPRYGRSRGRKGKG